MRMVGHRQSSPITLAASASLLAAGARFNDEIRRLPSEGDSFIPKGIYRFTTHVETNRHPQDCPTQGMVRVARERALTAVKAHPGTW